MKKILLTLTLFTVFFTTTVLATDLDDVKSRVNQIQTADTGLPTISEQKGTVGTIISLIFNGASGKIKSMFLEFGTGLSLNDIPRWDGVDFVTSEITDDGTNVGIGTNPNASDKLKINGNLLVTSDVKASRLCDINGANCWDPINTWASLASAIWNLNGSNAFYNGGNVGIGTNAPSAKLEVIGDETNASTTFEPIIRLGGADGNFAQFYRDNNGSNNYLGIDSYKQGVTGTKTPIVLQEFGGNVGIGTTSPTEKLDVNGSINTTGNIYMKNGTPTTYYLDQNNRSAMVHVNGNKFYILRGDGNGSTAWATYNGWRPMYIDLENNYSYFGGNMTVNGAVKTTCIGACF